MEPMIVNSRVYGEEHLPKLLVFHGLFGLSDNWSTLGREWSERFQVHLVDLRNHGDSFHSDEFSIEILAKDIFNYLQHHRLEQSNVLGHSLGGKAVMEFALRYPEKVKKVVVADMAPKSYPPHHQSIIHALRSVDFSKVSSRNEIQDALMKHINNTGIVQFLMKSIKRNPDNSFVYKFNLNAIAENYDKLLTSNSLDKVFQGEVLFLYGEKSNDVLVEDVPFIKKLFPNAKLQSIPNAGHWLHAEQPELFSKAVIDFLSN